MPERRGFYSSSDTEDNDSESGEDEDRLQLMLKGSMPRYTVTTCSVNKFGYCVVAFDDANLVNPIPELEKYRDKSLKLKSEVPVNDYVKYKLVRCGESKHPDANKDDEDFEWYDPKSSTTYFCLNMNNTLYASTQL